VSGRPEDLRRQRDLVREHLAWLDGEIAALDQTAQAPAQPLRPQSGEIRPAPFVPAPPDARDADAILEEYRQPPTSIARNARVGCLIYFGAALALMALAVVAFYFYARAARGH
jgi:hypothetical protein